MTDPPSQDYFVVTRRSRRSPSLWGCEIQRRSKPLGVKLYGADFISEHKAQIAGEKALKELADRLTQEELKEIRGGTRASRKRRPRAAMEKKRPRVTSRGLKVEFLGWVCTQEVAKIAQSETLPLHKDSAT